MALDHQQAAGQRWLRARAREVATLREMVKPSPGQYTPAYTGK
jgi:hypothetical protein